MGGQTPVSLTGTGHQNTHTLQRETGERDIPCKCVPSALPGVCDLDSKLFKPRTQHKTNQNLCSRGIVMMFPGVHKTDTYTWMSLLKN